MSVHRRATVLLAVLAALGVLVAWLASELAWRESEDGSGFAIVEDEHAGERVALAPSKTPASTHSNSKPTTTADAGPLAEKDSGPDGFATTGSLTGNVIDANRKPVHGARVLVLHAPELGAADVSGRVFAGHRTLDAPHAETFLGRPPVETATDAEGTFLVDRLPPGRLRIAVVHPDAGRLDRDDLLVVRGVLTQLGDVEIPAGSRVRIAAFLRIEEPALLAKEAALYMRSTFADASLPDLAPAALVELARSGPNGVLVSPPLPLGRTELMLVARDALPLVLVHDSGRAPQLERVLLRRGMESEVHVVGADKPHAPRFVRALPVTAARDDRVPFELRADARIARIDPESSTARLLALVPDEHYELRAGGEHEPWSTRSPWNPPAFFDAGEPRVVVRSLADATIAGSLRATTKDTPLAGLSLELAGATPAGRIELHSVHDPLGAGLVFRIQGVRPLADGGAPRLLLRGTDHAWSEHPLVLVSGETLVLQPIVVPSVARARFVVRDSATGKPVEGARVSTRPFELFPAWDPSDAPSVETDARGGVLLPTWGLANTLVRVEMRGWAPLERGFQPEAGNEREIELTLRRGTHVRVRVVDQDGAPLPGARIERRDGPWSPDLRVRDRDPGSISARERTIDGDRAAWTGADGVAHFPRVAPGQHAFFVERHAPLLEGEWTSREVPSTEVDELALASLRRTVCAGALVRGSEPVRFAEVALVHGGDERDLRDPRTPLPPGLDMRTDADGRFRFEHVPPGTYRLVARLPEQAWRFVQRFELPTDAKPFEIDLEARTLELVVLDAAGVPVNGARVALARPASPSEVGALVLAHAFGAQKDAGLPYTGWSALGTTDANGALEFAGIYAGETLHMRARSGDHAASATVSVRVPADATGKLKHTITLGHGGALALANGGRAATVIAIPAEHGTSDDVRTLLVPARGSTLLPGLAPGAWHLLVYPASTPDDAVSKPLAELLTGDSPTEAKLLRGLRSALEQSGKDFFQVVAVVAGETRNVELRGSVPGPR